MSTVNDLLFGLERDLDKYPPGQSQDWALNRRLVLRKALEAAAGAGREQGYHDGMRDASDAVLAQEEWDRRQAEENPDD